MTGQGSAKRRAAVIAAIIAGAILLGVFVDFAWGKIEEATHPKTYSAYVRQYSYEFNVPESIVYAVIKVESDFDPYAESDVGARGLMQMMQSTFEELTSDKYLGDNYDFDELFDPEVSIKYGTYYLAYLRSYFDGDWNNALAAYNGGMGNVQKWLSDPNYSDGKGNLTHIPFEETRNYVSKVNKEIENYKRLYYKNKEEVKNYEQ